MKNTKSMVALLMDGANNKNLPVTNVPVKLFVKTNIWEFAHWTGFNRC